MTDDQIERCDALWRELLAAGRVRWMPGMAAVEAANGCSSIYVWHDAHGANTVTRSGAWMRFRGFDGLLPDFNDPATIGCLLAMAREAAGDATAYGCVVPGALLDGEDRWCVGLPGTRRFIRAETEPEALLLAIQAATA